MFSQCVTHDGTLAEHFFKVHNISVEEAQEATNHNREEFWNRVLTTVNGKSLADQQVRTQPSESQPSERQPLERIEQSKVKQYDGEQSKVKQFDRE